MPIQLKHPVAFHKCGKCGYFVLLVRKQAEPACPSCGQKLQVDVSAALDSHKAYRARTAREGGAVDLAAADVEAESE